MSSAATGALAGAAICLAAAPYLARLVGSVPDREERRWWRGRRPARRDLVLVAVLAAGLGALAGAAARWGALLPAFVALALVAAPLIVIDLRRHRLPNRLLLVAFVAAAALLVVAAARRDAWPPLLHAAEGAAAVYAALWLLATVAPRSFGMGDVKLGAILGGYLGWFGWAQVYYGIFGGFLLGAVLSLGLLATGRATMKTAIPFGPMLVVGPLAVLAFDLVP